MAASNLNSECAVVFLVINQISDLPELAISSVLRNSNSPIFIGTVREQDRESLPKNERITYIDLGPDASTLGIQIGSGIYQSFEKDIFFSLVQLKWALFEKVSKVSDSQFIIYNDIDVFWLRALLPDLLNAFEINPSVQMMIQHFTWVPGNPQLCMGFVVFRKGAFFSDLIKEASKLHAELLDANPRTGDDDVITELYKAKNFPSEIQLLPQTTFPVGNLLNLFSKRDQFPGLKPFPPYIFHANFVVGLPKKLMISRIAYKQNSLDFSSVAIKKRVLMVIKLPIYRSYGYLRRMIKSI
jgi:Nucleotide-diphospho-sugar transferase